MSVLLAMQAQQAVDTIHAQIKQPKSALELSFDNVTSHDCEFTRGYWLGIVMRMISEGDRNSWITVPRSMVEELARLIGPDVRIDMDTVLSNRFGVQFARIRLTF